jgi:hypothetical protein
MISISPERGHSPYTLSLGSIQIAGHSQSPAGSFATTSTRPNLIEAPSLVLMRPDLTGLTIVPLVVFVEVTQSVHLPPVQPWPRRSITLFDSMTLWSCRVGLIVRIPSLTKTFSSVLVVISNWPLLRCKSVVYKETCFFVAYPKPPTSTSLVHTLLFHEVNSSLNTSQYLCCATLRTPSQTRTPTTQRPRKRPIRGMIVIHFSLESFFSNQGCSISPFFTRLDRKYSPRGKYWYPDVAPLEAASLSGLDSEKGNLEAAGFGV